MEKIKQFIESEKGKDVLVVIIVILVGLGSFELGRLSKQGDSSGIRIEYSNADIAPSEAVNQSANAIYSDPAAVTSVNKVSSTGKNYFASSRGSKYYPVGCSAGKTIKQENRVYFTTGEEAQKAGYALSSSCE